MLIKKNYTFYISRKYLHGLPSGLPYKRVFQNILTHQLLRVTKSREKELLLSYTIYFNLITYASFLIYKLSCELFIINK